jgi:glc operon protein GlcG
MPRFATAFLIALLLSPATNNTPAQLRVTGAVTLSSAKKMAVAAEVEAAKNNWRITVTVLDGGGNLVLAERMDDTEISSIETSQEKAHTAVIYMRPTSEFQDGLKGGNTAILMLKNVIPISGGLPIVVDGEVVGGIGVSGSGNPNDLQCAKAGLAVFSAK